MKDLSGQSWGRRPSAEGALPGPWPEGQELALLPLLSLPRPRLRRGCCPRALLEASLQLLSSFPRTCLSSLAPALN